MAQAGNAMSDYNEESVRATYLCNWLVISEVDRGRDYRFQLPLPLAPHHWLAWAWLAVADLDVQALTFGPSRLRLAVIIVGEVEVGLRRVLQREASETQAKGIRGWGLCGRLPHLLCRGTCGGGLTIGLSEGGVRPRRLLALPPDLSILAHLHPCHLLLRLRSGNFGGRVLLASSSGWGVALRRGGSLLRLVDVHPVELVTRLLSLVRLVRLLSRLRHLPLTLALPWLPVTFVLGQGLPFCHGLISRTDPGHHVSVRRTHLPIEGLEISDERVASRVPDGEGGSWLALST